MNDRNAAGCGPGPVPGHSLEWGSLVRSRVNSVAEILALPVLLALAALALPYARENGKDEKEGNKTDRFFIGFG